MFRDEEVYGKDSEKFRPERFLEGAKYPDAAFGFGRRSVDGAVRLKIGLNLM